MQLTIVVPQNTARIAYVLEWIFGQQLGVPYHVSTAQSGPDTTTACVIAYGCDIEGGLHIPASGLMTEDQIVAREPQTGSWQQTPILFADTTGRSFDLPFDIFSAVFYLLSRYEEYLPYTPDKHNRYPATDSILYRMGCLQRPLVDEWITMLAKLLEGNGLRLNRPAYSYLPSYDIDMAWSYRNKGLLRNAGGLLQDFLRGRLSAVGQRLKVLTIGARDPFDSFGELDHWHEMYGLQPIYFILSTAHTTGFDKNTPLDKPAMRALLRHLAARYKLGIHPSYFTAGNVQKAIAELQSLMTVSGQDIRRSRQHFIRLHLPDTCRMLLEMGVREDYSMGYGTHFGFRAGTANSFWWYDLPKERATALRMHPFCFMDATIRYYPEMKVADAMAILRAMDTRIRAHHGTLVTVMHNFTLGTDPQWAGWAPAYAGWLHEQQATA